MANRDAKLIERTLKDFSLGAMSGNGGGEGGSKVVANPELSGTETALTGLQVGETKYKVPSGSGGQMEIVTLNYVLDEQTHNITQEQATKLQNGAILTDQMGMVYSLCVVQNNGSTLGYMCIILKNDVAQIEEVNGITVNIDRLLYSCMHLGQMQ